MPSDRQHAAESYFARAFAVVGGAIPGTVLSIAVAISAFAIAPLLARAVPIPPIVIALCLGIVLNPLAATRWFDPGIRFCVRTVLRCAVALLGLRIAVGEIAELGAAAALLVASSMVITVASGFLLARAFGQTVFYGALAGAGTAVCGASATLATATVLPDYRGKQTDAAFVVIAVNTLSTLAMLLYPPVCVWLGFDARSTGIMLGATIHDVAQVAGAGYAVSEPVGNAAVIVKLFRVLLLFPVVVSIGWWFARPKPAIEAVKASVPIFALAFIALCLVNSVATSIASIEPHYTPIKTVLIEIANWSLLVAIAALGLGTSFVAIAAVGWRHVSTVVATTLVLLIVVTASLLMMR